MIFSIYIYGNDFVLCSFPYMNTYNYRFFPYFYGSDDIQIAIFDDIGSYTKSMLRPFSEQLQTLQDVRWLALCSPFLFGDQNCNHHGVCKILVKFVCNDATWVCFSDQNHNDLINGIQWGWSTNLQGWGGHNPYGEFVHAGNLPSKPGEASSCGFCFMRVYQEYPAWWTFT